MGAVCNKAVHSKSQSLRLDLVEGGMEGSEGRKKKLPLVGGFWRGGKGGVE